MSWGGPGLVVLIIAIVTIGWVLSSAVRGRGLDGDRRGGSRHDELDSLRAAELMAQENERLKGQVSRLEERIAVLERIATDPAERTAREIDNLR